MSVSDMGQQQSNAAFQGIIERLPAAPPTPPQEDEDAKALFMDAMMDFHTSGIRTTMNAAPPL